MRLLAAAMASHMTPDGVMYLAGEGRAGGRSAPAQLKRYFGTIQKLDSARHCVLYAVRDPNPKGHSSCRTISRHGPSMAKTRLRWKYAATPGVFADGSLQAVTSLLLDQLDSIVTRSSVSALDLGCGAGVIGATVLRRFLPAWSMDMTDSNALAS